MSMDSTQQKADSINVVWKDDQSKYVITQKASNGIQEHYADRSANESLSRPREDE